MKKIMMTGAALALSVFVFAQHTVTLKSGESKSGYVLEIQNGKLKLDEKGTFETINVSDISQINFEGGPTEAGEEDQQAVSADGNYVIHYKMKDRKIVKTPRIELGTQDKGIVVVNVTIDKYGNVQHAKSGADGTTTDNNYLLTKAMQFAQDIKFDKVPTAPLETRGTVTFTF